MWIHASGIQSADVYQQHHKQKHHVKAKEGGHLKDKESGPGEASRDDHDASFHPVAVRVAGSAAAAGGGAGGSLTLVVLPLASPQAVERGTLVQGDYHRPP